MEISVCITYKPIEEYSYIFKQMIIDVIHNEPYYYSILNNKILNWNILPLIEKNLNN